MVGRGCAAALAVYPISWGLGEFSRRRALAAKSYSTKPLTVVVVGEKLKRMVAAGGA